MDGRAEFLLQVADADMAAPESAAAGERERANTYNKAVFPRWDKKRLARGDWSKRTTHSACGAEQRQPWR